ncbi:Uncharacterised protein [Moraxella lacunata]|uniref:Uncharacterized protein n=1 Tax=Moraxella lacunata TaxID=477 RepID=A0A378TT50_MORLA|nr:DUF6578 domain-containing protein [Moraxella lacunata]STZ63032.1 Uncharacterised protein [Moraxella lacunata]
MTTATVFCENWQIDCCGDPFKIGDNVEWDCNYTYDDYRIKEAQYEYEAHLEAEVIIRGVVAEIYDVAFEQKDGAVFSYAIKPIEQVTRFGTTSGFLAVLHNVEVIK